MTIRLDCGGFCGGGGDDDDGVLFGFEVDGTTVEGLIVVVVG
jgi:hypothetical protein